MTPDVAYFILDYNPQADVKAALKLGAAIRSIVENRDQSLSAEFFVVSQGCQDETHRKILLKNATDHGFHLLDLRTNVGISRGINLVARLSRAKYVCMVSSDCVITQGMDAKLIAALQADPKCQLAIPLSQKSELGYQQHVPPQSFGDRNVPVDEPDRTCITYEFSVAMWPREAFENVGYYDERWKACYENIDWGLRAWLLGYNVKIVGSAFAWHSHGGCIKSGARNHTYDGYIEMNGSFDQSRVATLWDAKWHKLPIDLYGINHAPCQLMNPEAFLKEGGRLALSYVQEVGY